jgi:hypothetical protein
VIEPSVIEFLNGKTVLSWATVTLGLKRAFGEWLVNVRYGSFATDPFSASGEQCPLLFQ